MSEFQLVLYECTGHDTYADAKNTLIRDFRPSVGDFYLVDDGLFGTRFVKVDYIVNVNRTIFHVYCSRIEPDFGYDPYFGKKGNEMSLMAHTLDQIRDFPDRYGIDNASRVKKLVEDKINAWKERQKSTDEDTEFDT
jgi:hypothetical protein